MLTTDFSNKTNILFFKKIKIKITILQSIYEKKILLLFWVTVQFPGEYIPTTLDIGYGTVPDVTGSLSLSLWDTVWYFNWHCWNITNSLKAGREDYDRLR